MTVPPSPSPKSRGHYGRIARVYQGLEYIAFGRALEKTRSSFTEALHDARRIAVFGAGDGRCFRTLLSAAPRAQFLSVEFSPEMSQLARSVVAELAATDRVEFIEGDARGLDLPPGSIDGVVTQFFLDCFTSTDLDVLIPKIAMTLRPGSPWLFADFGIPERPRLARWRARAWIAVLCAFFRWQAGHALKSLPPMEPLLKKHGFRCEQERSFSWGLLRAAVYRK